MAFKINTYVSLPQTPIEPPSVVPPTEIKPPEKPQEPEKPEEKPNPPEDNNDKGEVDNSLSSTTNSAFSSLSLPLKEWLKKEFGITEETLKDSLPEGFLEALLSGFKNTTNSHNKRDS